MIVNWRLGFSTVVYPAMSLSSLLSISSPRASDWAYWTDDIGQVALFSIVAQTFNHQTIARDSQVYLCIQSVFSAFTLFVKNKFSHGILTKFQRFFSTFRIRKLCQPDRKSSQTCLYKAQHTHKIHDNHTPIYTSFLKTKYKKSDGRVKIITMCSDIQRRVEV